MEKLLQAVESFLILRNVGEEMRGKKSKILKILA